MLTRGWDPLEAHCPIMTMVPIPKNALVLIVTLACCCLPLDAKAGINFYVISDRYKLDITIAGSHSSLSLFLRE